MWEIDSIVWAAFEGEAYFTHESLFTGFVEYLKSFVTPADAESQTLPPTLNSVYAGVNNVRFVQTTIKLVPGLAARPLICCFHSLRVAFWVTEASGSNKGYKGAIEKLL